VSELISIITPAFRAEPFLAQAVHSVLAQCRVDWEMLIVADDGGDYGALLAGQGIRDPRLKFLTTGAVGSGAGYARNVGLEQARGEWIAPLDADDVFLPGRLRRLVAAASETGLALDNFRIVDDGPAGCRMTGIDFAPGRRFGLDDLARTTAPLLFVLHRTLAAGGWDADLTRGQDTIFNLRVLERAGYARFIDEPLHEYHVRPDSACHAQSSPDDFELAYQHTLDRLEYDGLGFSCAETRAKVRALLVERIRLNRAFARTCRRGFCGDYQRFVRLCRPVGGHGPTVLT